MLPESFGGRIIYLLQQYGPSFAKGAGVSMWLALVGTLFGCIIGFLVGIVQTIPVDKNDSTAKKVLIKIVKFILACYVEFFRGTPMMAQAMFIYFGSAYLFNINMSMWFAAIFIVSINTGAYMAETVRGGILSIDPGQTEGAKAIGMTHVQTMVYVILPQALRRALPSWANEAAGVIKASSLVYIIGVVEIMRLAQYEIARSRQPFAVYIAVALIYFACTYLTNFALRKVERRLAIPDIS